MNSTFPALGLRGATGMRFMLLATLAAGMLSMNAGRGTLAYFTTQVQSTANKFTAGNLHFAISDTDEASKSPSVTNSLHLAKMRPGDIVTAPVRIENTGTIPARYGIKYATSIPAGSTQDFTPGLKMAIVGSGTSASSDTTLADCTTANFGDTTKYPNSVRASAFMQSAGETVVTVDPATPGTGRTLDVSGGTAATQEVLCVQVQFYDPGTADNTYNAATSEDFGTLINFTFDGLSQ